VHVGLGRYTIVCMIAKNLVHAACASSPVGDAATDTVSQLLGLPFFKETWSTVHTQKWHACASIYMTHLVELQVTLSNTTHLVYASC